MKQFCSQRSLVRKPTFCLRNLQNLHIPKLCNIKVLNNASFSFSETDPKLCEKEQISQESKSQTDNEYNPSFCKEITTQLRIVEELNDLKTNRAKYLIFQLKQELTNINHELCKCQDINKHFIKIDKQIAFLKKSFQTLRQQCW